MNFLVEMFEASQKQLDTIDAHAMPYVCFACHYFAVKHTTYYIQEVLANYSR